MTNLLYLNRAAKGRSLLLALIVTMLVGATACGDLRSKRENLKNCEFELENLEVANFGFSKVDLLVQVGIQNPNPSDVVVDRVVFDLYTGDNKVADGKHNENITVPAGEQRSIKIEVATTPSQLGNTLLKALMSNGSVDYRVDGTVYIDTVLGEIPYPINLEGNTADSGP
ncbi:MAG: LEA type 2 family protein [bacterium]|nr:LEA type 2 family protein [bacterium]